MFCRVWVLVTTYFLMQPKPAKILEQIPSKIKANREIRNNNLKFLGGLLIITVTCIFCGA
jgi:choline-glycine betaine transporter